MSKLKNCPTCEKEIATNSDKCIHCGHRFTGAVTWVFTIVMVLFFTAVLFGDIAHAGENGPAQIRCIEGEVN